MRTKTVLCILLLNMILGTYRGYIALWSSADTDPIQIFPYKTALLPPADQVLLEEGISIDNEIQLHKLLRDYLS